MVEIQSVNAEIRREKKKKEEERNHRTKYNGLPYSQGSHIKSPTRGLTVIAASIHGLLWPTCNDNHQLSCRQWGDKTQCIPVI